MKEMKKQSEKNITYWLEKSKQTKLKNHASNREIC